MSSNKPIKKSASYPEWTVAK